MSDVIPEPNIIMQSLCHGLTPAGIEASQSLSLTQHSSGMGRRVGRVKGKTHVQR